MDFKRKKENFINNELLIYDDFPPDVIDAFLKNDYEYFLPDNLKEKAYLAERIKISDERYSQNLLITAELLKYAALKKDEYVLNIGSGFGYVTSLIASMVDMVVATEYDNVLYEKFGKNIIDYQLDNIVLFKAPKEKGYENASPYNVIIINDIILPSTATSLLPQLSEGGRIIGIEKRKSIYTVFSLLKDSKNIKCSDIFSFV